MTSVEVPERARKAARLTTVVVLPTPPFWFVQAVTLTTGTPQRVQSGFVILPVFRLRRADQRVIRGPMFHVVPYGETTLGMATWKRLKFFSDHSRLFQGWI